ncbi:MAG: hypothetical protein C4326_14535 [Ignavibacteria bacterium]
MLTDAHRSMPLPERDNCTFRHEWWAEASNLHVEVWSEDFDGHNVFLSPSELCFVQRFGFLLHILSGDRRCNIDDVWLAKKKEALARAEHGEASIAYANRTKRFISALMELEERTYQRRRKPHLPRTEWCGKRLLP